LILSVESEHDAEDFIAALLEGLDAEKRRVLGNKCLFISDPETWRCITDIKTSHTLLAHPNLDLESSGEQLHLAASKNNHAVIISVSGAWGGATSSLISLRSPSESLLQTTLMENGYKFERARELATAGALSLAALKRYLRGMGALPPYSSWPSARLLAQAGLLGRWSGENAADKSIIEGLLGKGYGEWIETIRPETLRLDTPLTQRNENWKIISRGEAWSALGPQLCNDDLERFQKIALTILGEKDPKFDLPPEERFAASVRGKVLKHSTSLRKGIAETLALLGSRPEALAACSQGKPAIVALVVVRELLKDADWIKWASLNDLLPLLAEAAPKEFLDSVEAALTSTESPFKGVYAQERPALTGWNYMTGLLWALETLAWDQHYLGRVTMLLGDLAAIDPGGGWANRPSNSLIHIFLPWHPQTCAPVEKRIAAIEGLLREQPAVAWKLLKELLPKIAGGSTSGSHKPTWRRFIPSDWQEMPKNREYSAQVIKYVDLIVGVAEQDVVKLAELIDYLPSLPPEAVSRILQHLSSAKVINLNESDRRPLWEALIDLAGKHRKFADAQWAMPLENVVQIEETAGRIAPKSRQLVFQRIFSERDFNLFEEKGDFHEQQKNLEGRRKEAVQEILKTVA
jgi:hypothetical protein